MNTSALKNFNLVWNQHDQYWLKLYPRAGKISAATLDALTKLHMQKMADGGLAIQTPRDWKSVWDQIYAALEKTAALDEMEVILSPPGDTALERKSPAAIRTIAESLWLGDALLEDRIMCYLQPVLSARDQVFGYESFVRAKAPSGDIIAGDKIIAACRALGIEFVIDRHLHVQAIRTFVSSQFNGFLFVNLFPGFIHRPAVYLEGLSETAKSFGIVAKHIVLDFTKSETPRDIMHLKNVCEYARSRGYSIALDDIESLENARKLVSEVHPDFVKIDMKLARQVAEAPKRSTIRQIVELVHAAGGTVIAEGVETEEMHQQLKQLGVDLFQGYLFSPPMPVEAALARSTGTN
jgi:EAL domain-containing protein (putative c-di-GMP-specific phosphodiesterase class I)